MNKGPRFAAKTRNTKWAAGYSLARRVLLVGSHRWAPSSNIPARAAQRAPAVPETRSISSTAAAAAVAPLEGGRLAERARKVKRRIPQLCCKIEAETAQQSQGDARPWRVLLDYRLPATGRTVWTAATAR